MDKRKKKKDKHYIKKHTRESTEKRFTIIDYIIVNLVVWLFIGIVALSFYMMTGFKVDGLQAGIFRFILLYAFGCVFSVVSIIDCAECSYSRRNTSASRRDS